MSFRAGTVTFLFTDIEGSTELSQEHAARRFGAAESLRENINIPKMSEERPEYDREVDNLRAHMDKAAFVKAWAEGRTLTMEQAIALALA